MDTKAAAEKISHAVPGARFSWTDYDCSLSVAHPTESRGYVVYRSERPDRNRPEIVGDVDAIIAELMR